MLMTYGLLLSFLPEKETSMACFWDPSKVNFLIEGQVQQNYWFHKKVTSHTTKNVPSDYLKNLC